MISHKTARAGLLVIAAATMSAVPATAAGYEPVGPDIQLSETDSGAVATAYDPTANTFLVTWEDHESREIAGRFLGPTGEEIGPQFEISDTGRASGRFASEPVVEYDPISHNFLVVWQDHFTADAEAEIFGQVVSASGSEVGADLQISEGGYAGGADVAFNESANEFLVAWEDRRLGEYEVFGQRVSSTGAAMGGDFRITHVAADGDQARGPSQPVIAANPTDNEYMVVWIENTGPDFEGRTFGQRVSAAGANLGSAVQIPGIQGLLGDLVFNPSSGNFLLVWEDPAAPMLASNAIFGLVIDRAGATVGGRFQISNLSELAGNRNISHSPAAVYNPVADEFLVTWAGPGPSYRGDGEIYGQRLTPGGGAVGGDCLISQAYKAGDRRAYATRPAAAYGSVADEYLVAWFGDEVSTEDESNVFARHLVGRTAECVNPTDFEAPNTKIKKAPPKSLETSTRRVRVRFSFKSTEPGSSFECRLDDGAFKPCGRRYRKEVGRGKHKLSVRAVDRAGIRDRSPATRKWKVTASG